MKIFGLLVVSIFLFSCSVAAMECDSVIFNNGASNPDNSYQLYCESEGADDLCPANYGNWGSCSDNYDGSKCFPCDPDCGACPSFDIFDFPGTSCPDIPFEITVRIYISAGKSANVVMLNNDGRTEALGTCTVATGEKYCDVVLKDTDGVSSSKSNEYDSSRAYEYKIFIISDEVSAIVPKTGSVGPKISIDSPTGDTDVSSDVGISVSTGYADNKVIMYSYKIEKKSSSENYEPVDVQNNDGSCGWCNPYILGSGMCNVLDTDSQISPAPSSTTWDTSVCDNNDFRITVEAFELSGESPASKVCSGSVDVTVNNAVPGVPGKPNVLNLVLARVKAWI